MTIHVEYECDSCLKREPATNCGHCDGHHPPVGWYDGIHATGDGKHFCGSCLQDFMTAKTERDLMRTKLSVVSSTPQEKDGSSK